MPSFSWKDIPLDFVMRMISRKFLCVVFLFWLVVFDGSTIKLPFFGEVAIVVSGMAYIVLGVVMTAFIIAEGKKDEAEATAIRG